MARDRTIIVSRAEGQGRAGVLRGILPDATLTADLAALHAEDVAAAVVDADVLTDDETEGVLAAVAAGRRVVWIGAGAAPRLPDGPDVRVEPLAEYVIDPVGDSAATRRFPRPLLVRDAVATVEAAGADGGGWDPLLGLDVHFTSRVCAAERVVGAGTLVWSGLGRSDGALRVPALRRFLATSARAPRTPRDHGVAVVGYGPHGGMGWRHGTAAAAVPGLSFVAAVDPSRERRKAAEADFPGISVYGDVDEVLRDDAVDVVVIATPPTRHADLARAALRSGRHAVVEKPLCITRDDADDLVRIARDVERVVTVHQNRRWDPDFVALRHAVAEGGIGELFNVETFVGGFAHPCRAWHSERRVSGGAVYDWGSHYLDWILRLYGELPATVVAHGHKRVWHDVTNLDQIEVRMRWDDGRQGAFVQSDVAAVRRPKFYVQGTEGTVAGWYRPVAVERVEPTSGYVREEFHHAEAPVALTLARYDTGRGITESQLALPPHDPLAFHRNLADHLEHGTPLAVPVEESRDVVALLELAQRSALEGGTVQQVAR